MSEEADLPVELRRVAEVHAEDAGDQGRDQEDRAPGGDLLLRPAQPVRRDGQLGVAEARDHVALALDEVGHAEHVVGEILEVHDREVADAGHLLARDLRRHVAKRYGGPSEPHEGLAEREELHRSRGTVGPVAVLGEHRVLDIVEAVVDRLGDDEVAIDDDVEERPQQETDLGPEVLGALELEPCASPCLTGNTPGVLVLGSLVDRSPANRWRTRCRSRVAEAVGMEDAVVDGDVEVVACSGRASCAARPCAMSSRANSLTPSCVEQLVELLRIWGCVAVDPDEPEPSRSIARRRRRARSARVSPLRRAVARRRAITRGEPTIRHRRSGEAGGQRRTCYGRRHRRAHRRAARATRPRVAAREPAGGMDGGRRQR